MNPTLQRFLIAVSAALGVLAAASDLRDPHVFLQAAIAALGGYLAPKFGSVLPSDQEKP